MSDSPSTPFLKAPGSRIFLTIWFGQLVSTIGSSLTGFALGVYIFDKTHSITLFALNIISLNVPMIVIAPFAGALVDRIDRKWAMIIGDTGAGLCTLAVVLQHLTGHLQIWHIILATFLNASFNTIQWPAWSATQSLLVPKEHLGRSGGMVQIGDALGQLFAPALAGVLYLGIGLGGIVAIDFATFLFAILTLLVARVPRPPQSAAGSVRQSLLKDAQFGFTYIWNRKPLLGLLLFFATINFLSGAFPPLVTPLVLTVTDVRTMGFLGSLLGFGMLVGTLVMSVWGGPKRKIIGLLGFSVVGAFFLTLVGFRLSLLLMTIGCFGFMFSMPIASACSQAIWQRKVEPDVQGRVFSARHVIAWVTTLPSMALAPLLAERFEPLMASQGPLAGTWLGRFLTLGPGRGIGVVLLISGLLTLLASAAFYLVPAVRHIEDLLPDAVGNQPAEAGSEPEIPAGDVTIPAPA